MKKLVSLVLTLIMLFSIGTAAFAAEVPQQEYTQQFWDVPKDHWAFSYIAALAEMGIISGHEDGSFWPDANVTRGEGAKMIALAAGLSTDDNSLIFTDMAGHWANVYANAIKNYLPNQSADAFSPDQALNRETMAAILVSVLGYELSYDYIQYIFSKFTDADTISYDLAPYVAAAVKNNLISGFDDNTFRGQDTLTRAEAATLIFRAFYEQRTETKDFFDVKSYNVSKIALPTDWIGNDGYRYTYSSDISWASADTMGNIYFELKLYRDSTLLGTNLYKRNINGTIEKIGELEELEETITANDNGVQLNEFHISDTYYDKYQDGLLITGSFNDADIIGYDLNKIFLYMLKDGNIELLSTDFKYKNIVDIVGAGYIVGAGVIKLVTRDLSAAFTFMLPDESWSLYGYGDVFDAYTSLYIFSASHGGLLKTDFNVYNNSNNIKVDKVWPTYSVNNHEQFLFMDDNLCMFINRTDYSLSCYDFAGKRKNIIKIPEELDGFVLNEILDESDRVFSGTNNELILLTPEYIYTLTPEY